MTGETVSVKIAQIEELVAIAGGEFIGRTRLQKTAYLLEITGLGAGFEFHYKHFGPYSEDLANTVKIASIFESITEEVRESSWGGRYSIYRSNATSLPSFDSPRVELIRIAAKSNPIALELMATAVFLAVEGYDDPWRETSERKPDKATEERLIAAKDLYRRLSAIDTPKRLPDL